jgi:hypothetical protein
VRVLLREDVAGLTVEVVDQGPEGPPQDDTDPATLFEGDQADPRVSLAVLGGLVDDVEITSSATGTTVRLRWPLPPRPV